MSGGGGDSNDGLWMLFFICAFICAFFWAIWHFFTPQVLQGYLFVRQGEMAVASLWTSDDYTVEVPTEAGISQITFGEARNILENVTPEQMLQDNFNHWQVMNATSLAVLKPMRFLFGGFFLLMMYYALFYGPTSHHRKKFNLQSLIQKQAETFSIIAPIVNFNPLTDTAHRPPGALVPAELPLFAEALSPEEWTAYNKVPSTDGKLKREAAEEAFTIQLGDRWQGPGKLKPYMQVLLAAFALKAARKRAEADHLLGEIAESWSHKGGLSLDHGLITKARKILKDKNISGNTLARCNRHAFVTTALLGALDEARSEGGVLAPAQFLWLRGHDRNLWYPLNNLGRQSYHAEAMGAMSHYRAEKQVQRPIPKPMLKDAVDVLAAYLEDNSRSMPIPQLDFSMIKNRKAPTKNKGIMKPVGT
jgi:intracellular multiplication protein IcmP